MRCPGGDVGNLAATRPCILGEDCASRDVEGCNHVSSYISHKHDDTLPPFSPRQVAGRYCCVSAFRLGRVSELGIEYRRVPVCLKFEHDTAGSSNEHLGSLVI